MKTENKDRIHELEHIYFAHPMPTYGTPLEAEVLERVRECWPNSTIENPAENPSRDMSYYFDRVRAADIIVFTMDAREIIGRGVYDEVQLAQELQKPVFFIHPHTKILTDKFDLVMLDKDNWKHYATIRVD